MPELEWRKSNGVAIVATYKGVELKILRRRGFTFAPYVGRVKFPCQRSIGQAQELVESVIRTCEKGLFEPIG